MCVCTRVCRAQPGVWWLPQQRLGPVLHSLSLQLLLRAVPKATLLSQGPLSCPAAVPASTLGSMPTERGTPTPTPHPLSRSLAWVMLHRWGYTPVSHSLDLPLLWQQEQNRVRRGRQRLGAPMQMPQTALH